MYDGGKREITQTLQSRSTSLGSQNSRPTSVNGRKSQNSACERNTTTLSTLILCVHLVFSSFLLFFSISDACLVFSLSPHCSFCHSCCCCCCFCCLFFFCVFSSYISFLFGCFLFDLSLLYVLIFFSYYYVLLNNRLLLLCYCYRLSPPPSPEKKAYI